MTKTFLFKEDYESLVKKIDIADKRNYKKTIVKIISEFQDEYEKHYKNILSDEVRRKKSEEYTLSLLLLFSINNNYKKLAAKLIEMGADVNSYLYNPDQAPDSLFKIAKQKASWEIVDQIASHPNFIPSIESIIYAIDDDNLGLLEKYLKKIPEINLVETIYGEPENIGAEAMFYAIKKDFACKKHPKPRYSEMVNLLLLYGFDPDCLMPIFIIKRNGSPNFVLDYSLKNDGDFSLCSPLALSCRLKIINPEIITQLLNFGAVIFSNNLDKIIFSDRFKYKLTDNPEIIKRLGFYKKFYNDLERILNISPSVFEKESQFKRRRFNDCAKLIGEIMKLSDEDFIVPIIQSLMNSQIIIKGRLYSGLIDFASTQKDAALMDLFLRNGGRSDLESSSSGKSVKSASEEKESRNKSSFFKSMLETDDFKNRSEINRLITFEQSFQKRAKDFNFLPDDAIILPAMIKMLELDLLKYPRDELENNDDSLSRTKSYEHYKEDEKKSKPPIRELHSAEKVEEKEFKDREFEDEERDEQPKPETASSLFPLSSPIRCEDLSQFTFQPLSNPPNKELE